MKRMALPFLAAVAFAACELPTDVPTGAPLRAPVFDLGMDPSLVARWKLDDGSGTVAADASGNGNFGTLMNGPTWVPGRTGTALSFDGVDDYVRVPDDDALDMVGDFTISLWVQFISSNSDADILRKGSAGTATVHYKIEMRSNRIRVKLVGAQRSTTLADNQTNRNDGVWHHVAVVREGSASRLYIDGVLVDSSNRGVGDLSNSANLAFGAKDTGNSDFLNGSIDDIRFYSRALTAQEISELVNSGDDTPPTVPQNVAADPLSAFKVQVTWDASGDPESGVSFYRVYRDNVFVGQSVVPIFTDDGLTAETTHLYEVSAVNGAGLESSRGGPVEATTLPDDGGPGNGGIVAHWKLDDGSGTVAADASGNGNFGTLMNGPTWVPGRTGTALSFDGVDDYVRVPDDDALDMVGDFTISLWVQFISSNSDADILRKGSAGTATVHYKIEMRSNRIRVKLVGAQRSTTLADNQTNRNDGVWHHVAVVREGSASRLYIDGVLVDSSNRGVGDLSNSANLAFGAKDTGGDDFFDGSIDDIRFYGRALTTPEISELVNSGDDTPPTVPPNVAAGPLSAFQIQVSWDPSSDPESGVSTYRIYRDGVFVGESLITPFTDSGLTPATTYAYEVSAVNGAGLESARGGPAEATTLLDDTPPTVPPNVAAGPLSAFQIQVSWDPSSDPESGVSTYRIYRDGVFVGESLITPFTDSGLTPATTYAYEVSAVNGAGLESARGGPAEATTLPDDGGPPGTVGYWKLDDGSGTVAADVSGNGNFGTLINGPTWIPGHTGTALSFDGVDDYVRVPDDDALDMVGDFTISLWLNWINSNSDADILRKGSAGTAIAQYKIELSRNKIKVRLVGPSRSITLRDGQIRNDGIWHHVAVVREGSVSRLYVDGVLVDSSNRAVGDLSNGANLAFGAKDTGGDDFFDGSIDDIRFYGRALTTPEISELVNSGG